MAFTTGSSSMIFVEMNTTLSSPKLFIISFAFSSLISSITAFAPSATKASIVACPRPEAPPVTRATLFTNSI